MLEKQNVRVATRSGSQEKLKKWKKSGKNKDFWKKCGNLTKFKKSQILSVYIYKIPYFQKPSNGKKLIKNQCQTKFAKFS